jgi:hypothetical protein
MALDYSSEAQRCCHYQVAPLRAIRPTAGAPWVAVSVTASRAAFRPPTLVAVSPLRRFEQPRQGIASRHRGATDTLGGWLGFQRICSPKLATLLGSSLPLWPLQKLAFEVFASPSVRKSISFSDDPLVTFRSPPELAHPGAAEQDEPCSASSLAVSSPTAFS